MSIVKASVRRTVSCLIIVDCDCVHLVLHPFDTVVIGCHSLVFSIEVNS